MQILPIQLPALPTLHFLPATATWQKVQELAKRVFLVLAIATAIPFGFFSQGLSDFLGLQTLRHGTSWPNYFKIHLEGPNPAYGGGVRGATFGHKMAKVAPAAAQDRYIAHSNRKFFAYLDSTVGTDTPFISSTGEPRLAVFKWYHRLYYQLHIRVAPHSYGFGAGSACAAPPHMDGRIIVAWRFFCGVCSFFSPPVKLRYRPEDIYRDFQSDPKLAGTAVYTLTRISTDHLGLTGIFKQAADGKMWQRMQARPGKTLWGAIRLINPIGVGLLASFGVYYLTCASR